MGPIHRRREEARRTREARVRGDDAGVSQSAFLAMLIAVVLAITTFISSQSTLGDQVTADWICKLLQLTQTIRSPGEQPGQYRDVEEEERQRWSQADDGPRTGMQADDGPHTAIQQSACMASGPPNTAPRPSDLPRGPVVLDIDMDDLDQGQIDDLIDDMLGGRDVCQWARDNIENYPIDLPMPEMGTWSDCGAVIQTGDGGFTIEIPEDEMHTDIWGWVIQIIGASVGFAAGALSNAICLGIAPEAALMCPAISGGIGTFFWILATSLVGGKSISDWDVWVASLAGGIGAAVGGAAMGKYVIPWAQNGGFGKMLTTVGNTVVDVLKKVGSWIGDSVLTPAVNAIQNGMARMREKLDGAVLDWLAGHGIGVFGRPGGQIPLRV